MKTINLILFGIGNVGSTLIHQINNAKSQLLEKRQIDIKVLIAANSKLALFNNEGVSKNWKTDFNNSAIPYDFDGIINYIKSYNHENLVAIDATASKAFVNNYTKLIAHGFHIVSANKIANTLDLDFYKTLRKSLKRHKKTFLYETNVGAGLPVIETVRNLHASGERIEKIRGVFSGSLSYIFNTFSKEDIPFSNVLKNADALGLTEPDAREDLSGNDVARKLLILARELELNTEFEDVKIESLVPEQLNGKTTIHQFKNRIKELDAPLNNRKKELDAKNVLRYVGELDLVKNTLEVKLIQEHNDTAIGQLKGADSVFEIYSESYTNSPLVIKGAGAGAAVTARGLFGDIMKLTM